MNIKTIPITQLSLDPNNARRHSEKNIEAIAASLEKFGQRKPIVSHRGVIIAGNGTVEAAKTLGWTEITVAEVPEDWDLDTAKAYALADNRSAELAEWDETVLAKQLIELQDADWDISKLGFEAIEVPKDDLWSDVFEKTAEDHKPFTQMTFVLAPEQVEEVKRALEKAKGMGDFIETGNDNSNGNALARIVETFNTL